MAEEVGPAIGGTESTAPTGSPLDEIVDLNAFVRLADDRLAPDAFDYIDGASWDEWTAADNPAAFRRHRLRPRVLVDVRDIDLSTVLLGTPVSLPVGVAPTAFQ